MPTMSEEVKDAAKKASHPERIKWIMRIVAGALVCAAVGVALTLGMNPETRRAHIDELKLWVLSAVLTVMPAMLVIYSFVRKMDKTKDTTDVSNAAIWKHLLATVALLGVTLLLSLMGRYKHMTIDFPMEWYLLLSALFVFLFSRLWTKFAKAYSKDYQALK